MTIGESAEEDARELGRTAAAAGETKAMSDWQTDTMLEPCPERNMLAESCITGINTRLAATETTVLGRGIVGGTALELLPKSTSNGGGGGS